MPYDSRLPHSMTRFIPILVAGLVLFLASCANFKKLKQDLEFMEHTTVVSVQILNASEQGVVRGLVVEWDREEDEVLSADYVDVGPIGIFSLFVERTPNQYVLAFEDLNHDQRYEPDVEPAWIHSDSSGEPTPVPFDGSGNLVSFKATLSTATFIPDSLVQSVRDFVGDRTDDEAARGWKVPIDIGVVADLDSEKFTAERGDDGLWEPASFPMESGLGLYFLQEYDPDRVPVVFVYGAMGSPQNWNTFFERLDRTKYQAWFYYYPSGRRLDEMGIALNRCIDLLQQHYDFPRVHLVAHSMGGLVARSAILHSLKENHTYIDRFVSLSTPWDGLKSVNAGIKMAPAVVPSWYDMSPGSPFLEDLFATSLKGKVEHFLIYTTKSSNSIVLPKENDGTVSVASETMPAAIDDADKVISFEETHVSILHSEAAIQAVQSYLDSAAASEMARAQ